MSKAQRKAKMIKLVVAGDHRVITKDDVARRAYELFLERGGQHGHDIEDWLRAERELRALEQQAASLTRELNEKNVQSLTRIKDGAERASKIVKNLLAFTRQEKPERKPTQINAVLKKALELRAYELKVSNIEVNTDLAPDLQETMADPHQLQQVFLNLIVNAEQAMIDAHGKGLLRLSTRAGRVC